MKYLGVLVMCFLLSNTAFSQNAKDIVLTSIDGEEVNVSDVLEEHDYAILAFWATWCKPCLKELAAYNDAIEELREDYNVQVLAISVDDTRSQSKVKPLANAQDWDFPVFSDSNKEAMRAFNFVSVPSLALVNKDGEVVYRHVSYKSGDEDEIFELLEDQ